MDLDYFLSLPQPVAVVLHPKRGNEDSYNGFYIGRTGIISGVQGSRLVVDFRPGTQFCRTEDLKFTKSYLKIGNKI